MLRLNRFSFLAPSSLKEAAALLEEHGSEAMLMAGGTDLLINIKHRLATPSYLIALRHLPELGGVTVDNDGGLRIGAAVSLKTLENHPLVRARYPALAEAAHLVSTPQVRAVGTIGGNICLDVRCNYYNQSADWRKAIGYCMKKDSPICRVAPGGDRCWAVSSADTVPALIALRAEVTVADADGTRRIPLETVYQDDGLVPLTLRFGEIVSAVHIPAPNGWRCVYQKFRIRQSFDFPLVGIAAAVKLDRARRVDDARIVMTAVASFPERAAAAEAALRGQPLSAGTIEAAGQTVFRLAKPMDNTAGTIFHRKRMARVLTERALHELSGDESSARAS